MSTEIQKTNGNGQSKAIVKPAASKMNDLRSLFDKSKGSIAAILPKHLTPEQILKITLSAVSRTPALLDCSAKSILMCVMQAAALGLPPNTPLGLSYLVPFKGEATFIPGYRGLIRLAIQSGEVQQIWSRVVHKKDLFEVEYGSTQKLVHKPCLEEEPGEFIGAYAVAEMKNGSRSFEFMSKAQIEVIRKRSASGNDGPWVTDFEEMARKTPLRRLCKSLPLSEEKLGRAMEHATNSEGGAPHDYSDVIDVFAEEVPAEETSPAADGLRGRLAEQARA